MLKKLEFCLKKILKVLVLSRFLFSEILEEIIIVSIEVILSLIMGDSKQIGKIVEKSSSLDKASSQEIGQKPKEHDTPEVPLEEKIEKVHEADGTVTDGKVDRKPLEIVKIDEIKEQSVIELPVKKAEENLSKEEPKGKPLKQVAEENGSNENLEEKPSTIEEKKDKDPDKPIGDGGKSEQVEDADKTLKEKQRISSSVTSCFKQPRDKVLRNQSDIFSLREVPTTLQTSIFSVNGCPSRKVFKKQEPAGHLFQSRMEEPPADIIPSPSNRLTKENYNDEKRPSSSYRNPLTGSGLSSNDEYKSKGIKRKDGNPLLGLGYDSEVSSVASQHRIPPGGYSHQLW